MTEHTTNFLLISPGRYDGRMCSIIISIDTVTFTVPGYEQTYSLGSFK